MSSIYLVIIISLLELYTNEDLYRRVRFYKPHTIEMINNISPSYKIKRLFNKRIILSGK